MTDIRAQLRRQLELEDESRALGARRYESRDLPWKTDAGTIEEEANLPPGRQLLKLTIEPTAGMIREFLEASCSGKAGRRHVAADFLLLSEPNEVAYLTARVMINASTTQTTLQNAAVNVANAVIENLEMHGLREINKKGYKGFLKAQEKRGYSRQRRSAVKKLFEAEKCDISIAHNEKVTLGTKCIEMLVEATGLFKIERITKPKGYIYAVMPTEPQRHWFHYACLMRTLLDTGLRLSEALNMKTGTIHTSTLVDPRTGQPRLATFVELPRYTTKSKKPRRVPLSDAVLALRPTLEAIAVKGRWFPWPAGATTPWVMWNDIRDDLKAEGWEVGDVKQHTFRHTCATRLARGGLSLQRLKEWLGHHDIKITEERYGHLCNEDLLVGLDIQQSNYRIAEISSRHNDLPVSLINQDNGVNRDSHGTAH